MHETTHLSQEQNPTFGEEAADAPMRDFAAPILVSATVAGAVTATVSEVTFFALVPTLLAALGSIPIILIGTAVIVLRSRNCNSH